MSKRSLTPSRSHAVHINPLPLVCTARVLLGNVPFIRHNPNEPKCCQPGDITVTQIHRGYLLGRVLDHEGPGPWWSYVLIAPTRESAFQEARTLAARAGVNAWLQVNGDGYEPLPDA